MSTQPIETMLIISDPKRFEPRDTRWEDGKCVGLEEILHKFPGEARGDLIMVLVKHPLDVVTVGGKTMALAEWFHSMVIRWTGTSWEVVGLGTRFR